MVEVDVRGLSCPMPIARTDKAMQEHPNEELTVLVETAVSKENVTRLAQSKGYTVKLEKVGDDFRLQLTPPGK